MSSGAIPISDARLLINKLMEESTPLVAFLSCSDGSFARVAGCIETFTNKVGLVISSVKGKSVEVDTLCLAIGDGTSCEFFFGDHREMPEPVCASMVKRYGDTVLGIKVGSTGSVLSLFYNS
jgi:hypothetical protein